jgi:hypothetical protein
MPSRAGPAGDGSAWPMNGVSTVAAAMVTDM